MAAAQSTALGLDAQPPSPERSSSSSSQPRFISSNPFRRSSGSFTGRGVLARLSSASSLRAQTAPDKGAEPRDRRPSLGRRISSRTSNKSADGFVGANLAELSKPTGKFKSGIKWESQQTPEPFMEVSDSTATERELVVTLDSDVALASGSTAAAQAHAQSRGLGQPVFHHHYHRSSPSVSSWLPSTSPGRGSTAPLPTVSQTISALGNSGVNPEILGSTNTEVSAQDNSAIVPPAPTDSKEPQEHEAEAMSGEGATPCTTPPIKSRQPSHAESAALTADNHMVARAAQLVLEAARQQARVETRKKGKSAPASPKRISSNLSPTMTNDQDDSNTAQNSGSETKGHSVEITRTPSQRVRSKSEGGGDGQVKRRKSFLRAVSSRKRRSKEDAADFPQDGSETPTPAANSPIVSGTSSGTVTPGGRRRRYADTRDLDVLARELAAEAIAEQVPQPPFARASRSGSSSPHRTKAGAGAFNDPRRRSFPSIQEDAPLQDDSITPIPAATNPNGLKPLTPLHASRQGTRARAAAAPSSPSDPTNGMVPKEMFLGLGGSPYPSLSIAASRSASMPLETLDPFGIPITQDSSPFDATMAYANKTHVYHTPNQVAISRSHSGASTWSASQTQSGSKRRPVLTMTMKDPDAELQGLTKPPKEGGSKRLTPFGSRANSRAPSPSPSFTNLKVAAQRQSMDQGPTTVDNKELAALTTSDVDLGSEEASVRMESRRNSLAVSERSIHSRLTPSKANKMSSRLSTFFRSNKSKVDVDKMPTVKANLDDTSQTTSPDDSAYATPSAETALSPQSAAVSSSSDADVSPVAFNKVELPPTTQDSPNQGKLPSNNASRRSSIALDPTEPSTPRKQRPIRALLRRLSSFSGKSKGESKGLAKQNSPKANFPSADTMPAVDMKKLNQLSQDAKANEASRSEAMADSDEKRFVDRADGSAPEIPRREASIGSGLVQRLEDLDLSNASPALVNEEMAKNGFGTRSAYKLEGSSSSMRSDLRAVELEAQQQTDAVERDAEENGPLAGVKTPLSSTEDEVKEAERGLIDREDGWERSRPAAVARTDSQTPSSEDSFFLGSGHSTTSRPGSGALMKHGSESAISEELHTPDPSMAHLPGTNKAGDGLVDDDALSSTVSNVTAKVSHAMPKVQEEGQQRMAMV